MKDKTDIGNHELDELFERYRQAPESYVFVLLADACRKMGRIDEALEICGQGVARHPRYASGYVVKGKCLYDQGNQELARETFGEVLTLDANNLVALKYLGVIEADSGCFDKARECFQHILALDPDNGDIKSILKDVDEREQIETGDPEPVETEPAATASDNDVAPAESQVLETSDELATITLADIFASQGYKKKALKIYSELLKKQPDSPLILAKIEALTGDRADDGDTAVDDAVGASAVTESEPESEEEVAGFEEICIDDFVSDEEETEGSEEFESFTKRSAARGEAEPRPQEPESSQPERSAPATPELADAEPELTKPEMVTSEAVDEADPAPTPRRKAPKRSGTRSAASHSDKRAIDEKENLKYFRNWLNRMQD